MLPELLTEGAKNTLVFTFFSFLGGLAIGLIPGLPEVRVDPDVILVGLLPPLLFPPPAPSVSGKRRNGYKPKKQRKCSKKG